MTERVTIDAKRTNEKGTTEEQKRGQGGFFSDGDSLNTTLDNRTKYFGFPSWAGLARATTRRGLPPPRFQAETSLSCLGVGKAIVVIV